MARCRGSGWGNFARVGIDDLGGLVLLRPDLLDAGVADLLHGRTVGPPVVRHDGFGTTVSFHGFLDEL